MRVILFRNEPLSSNGSLADIAAWETNLTRATEIMQGAVNAKRATEPGDYILLLMGEDLMPKLWPFKLARQHVPMLVIQPTQ